MKNKICQKSFCFVLLFCCLFSIVSVSAEENTNSITLQKSPTQTSTTQSSSNEIVFQLDSNKDYLQQVTEHNQKIFTQSQQDTEILKACSFWLSTEDYEQINFDSFNSHSFYAISYDERKKDMEHLFPKYTALAQYNDKIKEIALEITENCSNDYEKCKAVHDWICENIWYDMDKYYKKTNDIQESYVVLANKRGVCEGYANLTVEMLRSIDIPAKKVHGTALIFGMPEWTFNLLKEAEAEKINHAWTEAYVNGKWIIIDTTWDSFNEYENGKYGKKEEIEHDYFDVDIKTFSKDHLITRYEIPKLDVNKYKNETIHSKDSTTYLIDLPVSINGVQPKINIRQISYVDTNRFYKNKLVYKLRDLEQALLGTEKQFGIAWDAEHNAINLITGSAANPKKTEVILDNGTGKKYETKLFDDVPIYLNGKKTNLSVCTINGSNYVQLREFAEALNIGIGMDLENWILRVDTSKDYKPAPDLVVYR